MDNNIKIKEIYNNTVDLFIKNIPDDKKEYMKNMYLSYLIREYSKHVLTSEDVDYYSSLEIIRWKNFSMEGKLSVVSEDENLDKLINLSLEGCQAAEKFVREGVQISKEYANDKLEEMNLLYENVKEFNKDLATFYYSEGSLDFSYASGLTDLMSLRTGRIK